MGLLDSSIMFLLVCSIMASTTACSKRYYGDFWETSDYGVAHRPQESPTKDR